MGGTASLLGQRFVRCRLAAFAFECVTSAFLWNRSVNHLDPRPRQRDYLADANPPDEKETKRHRLCKSDDRNSALSAFGKRQEMS